jgi:hypothetical protein
VELRRRLETSRFREAVAPSLIKDLIVPFAWPTLSQASHRNPTDAARGDIRLVAGRGGSAAEDLLRLQISSPTKFSLIGSC